MQVLEPPEELAVALGLSMSPLGPPSSTWMRVVKVGVSKGGGSLAGNSLLLSCVADDLQVRNVPEAREAWLQTLRSFGLRPSTQPWSCAPVLGRLHLPAPLTTASLHYGFFLTE